MTTFHSKRMHRRALYIQFSSFLLLFTMKPREYFVFSNSPLKTDRNKKTNQNFEDKKSSFFSVDSCKNPSALFHWRCRRHSNEDYSLFNMRSHTNDTKTMTSSSSSGRWEQQVFHFFPIQMLSFAHHLIFNFSIIQI